MDIEKFFFDKIQHSLKFQRITTAANTLKAVFFNLMNG